MVELRRRNLSQLISDQLLERIRAGQLRPGERLPTEQGLMEEFGVGRNVVREAVQHLVALGVVDVRPKRGIVISQVGPNQALDALAVGALLDNQTVEDLYAFRLLVESEIAACAAERCDEQDIAAIVASLAAFERSLGTRTDIFAADVAFHQQLASASGNVIYASVLANLTDLLELYRRETDNIPGAPEQALIEHTAIAEAVQRHDPIAAREAMTQHIKTAISTVSQAVDLRRRATQRDTT